MIDMIDGFVRICGVFNVHAALLTYFASLWYLFGIFGAHTCNWIRNNTRKWRDVTRWIHIPLEIFTCIRALKFTFNWLQIMCAVFVESHLNSHVNQPRLSQLEIYQNSLPFFIGGVISDFLFFRKYLMGRHRLKHQAFIQNCILVNNLNCI